MLNKRNIIMHMPELPEVETVRRQLQTSILHKPLTSIEVMESSLLRQPVEDFVRRLERRSFVKMDRIGKLLMFHLDSGETLMVHLKMTGQFLYQDKGVIKAGVFPLLYASAAGGKKTAGRFREDQLRNGVQIKHTHLFFHFEDGSRLAFRDVRKFGYLKVVSAKEIALIKKNYGIDPLSEDFTREHFREVFEKRKKSLKSLLMDQSLIAGIGNIYADEICHKTKILPHTSVVALSNKQLDALYDATMAIIMNAVELKGTTLRDFTGTDGEPGNFSFELKAYGRQGEDCLQCNKGTIKKITYQGRGTHYCPNCQH